MSKKNNVYDTQKIDPNSIPVRDNLMVDIINGVTKGGPHTDRRKERNKYSCRGTGGCYYRDDD